MSNTLLQKLGYKSQLYLSKHAPTILTCLGVIGIVGTGITAVSSTTKAVRLLDKAKHEKGDDLTPLEIVKTVGALYIPPVLIGASTIACVVGSNVLNKHKQLSLASAYSLVNESYKTYIRKLKELYGAEADEKIREAIANDTYKSIYPDIYPSVGFEDAITSEDDKVLFYDEQSHRYFNATQIAVQTALYHLNRNFTMGGWCCLNDFYDFLGLPLIQGGDEIGWDICDGFSWIDSHALKTTLDDGLECYILRFDFDPQPVEDA